MEDAQLDDRSLELREDEELGESHGVTSSAEQIGRVPPKPRESKAKVGF